MAEKLAGVRSLSGVELHRVLQIPEVRAVFDEMMALKHRVAPPGPGYAEVHERLQLVGAEWFRISREAADKLKAES